VSIGGEARIRSDPAAVRMAISLIPADRISFREITTADP
jgi:hypothetical protein